MEGEKGGGGRRGTRGKQNISKWRFKIIFQRTLEHSNAYISQCIKYKTKVSTDSKSTLNSALQGSVFEIFWNLRIFDILVNIWCSTTLRTPRFPWLAFKSTKFRML